MKDCEPAALSGGPDAFWSPYLDFAAYLRNESPWRSIVTNGNGEKTGATFRVATFAAPEIFEPVFVRSALDSDAFFGKVDADSDLRYEPMEKDLNGAKNRPTGAPLEVFLYSRVGATRKRGYYEVLHVGAPVTIESGTVAYRPRSFRSAPSTRVALGIIDDGICYLNKRFTKSRTKTRFLSFWQQSLAKRKNALHVELGKLTSDDTDLEKLLTEARMTGEGSIYRRENRDIYPAGLTRTAEQAASHGTHILDLAIGADPDKPATAISDVPNIGVQLPPDSIDDTSGTRLETHLLQGLRWMIYEARRNRVENLVVNVSLGVLAGPKDGSKFVEQQIAREIAKAAIPIDIGCGQMLRVRVDVVLPFGSEYESRQVALLTLEKGKEKTIGLKLPRDDLTPNCVEIRPIRERIMRLNWNRSASG